jgi:CRISPR-associated protein Cas1
MANKPESAPEPPPQLRPKSLPIAPPDVPPLVPARMVNELLYCPRLFYLEWVQGEFAHNEFTAEGKQIHETSDKPRGEMEDGVPFEVRSLWLSSERLGLTAKIDVVQGDAEGSVVPVEHKRGEAPKIPEGAWLPERAQVCAQALLLRDHGYTVDVGAIWFAGSRKRVAIALDDELVRTTLDTIARARELASRSRLPDPLEGEDAKKCEGCSLVGICLPDEVRLLRDVDAIEKRVDGEADPPAIRRLMAARDERRSVYVQDQGSRIGVDGERLIVKGKEQTIEARLPNTSHVSVFGNVQISTQAVRALLQRGIPLLYFSFGGWFYGRTVAAAGNNVDLRVAQLRAADDPTRALAASKGFVAAKIRNARTMIRRNHPSPDPVLLRHLEILAKTAEQTDSIASLLGVEGTAARSYFGGFAEMLDRDEGFDLDGRNRRPPKDPVNALLSFCYALLVKDCTLALSVAGLDPMVGFYHRPRFARPALSLDMMEELRPIVADSVVLGAINTGVVSRDDFVIHTTGVALKAPARKRVLLAYERRMDQEVTHPVFGYRLSYRRVLEVQARLLGRWVLGEIEAYPSFRTR